MPPIRGAPRPSQQNAHGASSPLPMQFSDENDRPRFVRVWLLAGFRKVHSGGGRSRAPGEAPFLENVVKCCSRVSSRNKLCREYLRFLAAGRLLRCLRPAPRSHYSCHEPARRFPPRQKPTAITARSTKMLAKVSIGTSSDGGELGTCSEIRGQFHASPAAAMLAADAAIALRMLTLARNRPSSASVAISDARRLPGCLPHLGPMQRRVSPEH
jgi:hypothetical protein